MSRLRLIFLSFLLPFVLFSACRSWAEVEYKNHEISDLFNIELPSYLSETTDLNNEAEAQYQNALKNLCLIIRKNDWQELRRRRPEFVLEDYYDVSIEQLKVNLERIDAPAPDSISLNGLSAFKGSLSGTFKGDRIQFDICTIAGKRYLYQLLIWSTIEDRDQYHSDIEKIIYSFEEIAEPTQIEETQSDLPSQPLLPDSIQTQSQPQNMPSDQ